MTAISKISPKQIYLFEDQQDRANQNSLKEFIYYLRFNGKKGIIDFSYASSVESIHPALSIKENFILDAVPTSLIKNKDDRVLFFNRAHLGEVVYGPLYRGYSGDFVFDLEEDAVMNLIEPVEEFIRIIEDLIKNNY